MHPDLGYFVLDMVNDIIEFQENGDLNDVIILLAQFLQLFLDVFDEFTVGTEMHGLDGSVHDWDFQIWMEGLSRQSMYEIPALTPRTAIRILDALSDGYPSAYRWCCAYTPAWQPDWSAPAIP